MEQDKTKEENFEALLESSFTEKISLEPGQLFETKIISITGDCIFLDLNGKSEGQLDATELLDKEGNITVQVGDTIKAYFLYPKNGEMIFTTKIGSDKADKSNLEQAFNNGIPVEGVVEKETKGGFEVKIGETRAFCPFSQMGLRRVDNPGEYLGKNVTFKIIEFSENGRNILLSNRKILEAEHENQVGILKQTLKEGMVIKGTVKSLQKFGAFVDVQGIQALLPISEISRNRVEDLSKILTVGQEIEASILKLDWTTDRISISMKKLLADPWDLAKSKYPTGSKHSGKIVRLMDFGAFVSLEPGLDGLIHISDLESDRRINHPREVVKEGQTVNVMINNIDIKNKRISLKPVIKSQENEAFEQYMEDDNSSDTDTYNPFSALLKDKNKRSKKR